MAKPYLDGKPRSATPHLSYPRHVFLDLRSLQFHSESVPVASMLRLPRRKSVPLKLLVTSGPLRSEPLNRGDLAAGSAPLDELQQHARRALRVHEHIPMAPRTGLDLIRHQANTVALQFCNRRRQIGNAHTNMMQSLSMFDDEFGNRRIV